MLRSRPEPLETIELVEFALFENVSHGITTRRGGVSPAPFESLNMGLSTGDVPSNVRMNRSLLANRLQISLDHLLVARLSHGNAVSVFKKDQHESWPWHEVPLHAGTNAVERAFRTDAVISDVPGVHFLLSFADCVPLIFWDSKQRVVGAAHAGWRGTAMGIAPRVIQTMQAEFGTAPEDLVVGVGPSIGPCCYSVQQDTLEVFKRGNLPYTAVANGAHLMLDLWDTNEKQLVEAGIQPSAIENPRLCTSCGVDMFYSHRRERGQTGRFALCAGIH